ncbi:MAG: tRNA pseudouridine(38-40) synthase TruA [Alphaproteobacteria bacterium]|nr:MAG: tRNA pseudouridine(38-40) synthase TruA [Alphaproteobacteria bacterium]
MPRFALIVEYDGAPFAGWQRQKDQPSVQEALERALARLDPGRPAVTGAGRTDAGVHALAQVAHADLARDWDGFRLAGALNHHLRPQPVAVLRAGPVAADFHARFSATRRHYFYRLIRRRAPLTLEAGRAWQIRRPLDVAAMRAAAAALVGRHDFTTFRSAQCQADSPVRTLDRLEIEEIARPDGEELRFHLEARSFLHNQVRSIVGSLERVGSGAWPPERVGEALAARERAACGPVAPPQGLYLVEVSYPEPLFAGGPGASAA